jgi:hypothetical protein
VTQTVKGSFVEAITNTLVGFSINYTFNEFVLGPMLVIHIPIWVNLVYGAIMTVVSVVRGFALRRLFNWIRFGNKEEQHV